MFNFKENEILEFPILCISIHDDVLVFSTKKIGSRFFEESDLEANTINFHVNKINENAENDDTLIYNGFAFSIFPHMLLVKDFFRLLDINSISELFSDKIYQKYKFVFIIRNPMDRFYTGLFEKIDSVFSEIISDDNGYTRKIEHKYYTNFTQNIIKKYFNIDEIDELKNRNQNVIDSILNEFAISLDYTIFNDSHLSLWNTFMIEFIESAKNDFKFEVIDLNDSEKINNIVKKQTSQPSNKKWITDWLGNPNNKSYIDIMNNNLKYYLDLELESYQKLLNKK